MVSELTCGLREGRGSASARRLRAAGRVPAVVYGRGKEGTPLEVSSRDAEALLRSGVRLLTLHVAGEAAPRTVLIREVQSDPVTQQLLHVDFCEVSGDQAVEVRVLILLRGKPAGAADGGELVQTLHEMPILCLPDRIPTEITVDVSGLALGDAVRVRDLALPEGVKAAADADTAVARCRRPQQVEEEVAAPVEGVEPAAPEVIGRKRGEEEEAEGA